MAAQLSSKQCIATAPFTASRAVRTPRGALSVRAQQQGGESLARKVVGAVAAAQIALLPLSGAAVADVLPWNTAELQQQVLFGFGEKAEKVSEAVAKKVDEANAAGPDARNTSVGNPGESQEENAEAVRLSAENGPTPGGDARAPTDGGAPAQ